ncbi:MAG: hypothetical protein R3B84_13155 [Zavarzinella sp.]
MKFMLTSVLLATIAIASPAAEITVKGRVIWDTKLNGPIPKRAKLVANKDADVAAKDDDFYDEDWVIAPIGNGTTGSMRDCVVILTPTPAKGARISPKFKPEDISAVAMKAKQKDVVIDQPCCRFIPHCSGTIEGQKLIIKNSSTVPHNAKYVSSELEGNPLIPPGGEFTVPTPLPAMRSPISLSCSIHGWMKAYIYVFDHPYFYVTLKDGKFEIPNVPALEGKLNLVLRKPDGLFSGGVAGRLGITIDPAMAKDGVLDLGDVPFLAEIKK